MTDVNRDKIIAAAKDAGMQGMLTDVVTTLDEIERFYAIAFEAGRQAEREECAEYVERGIGDWQLGKKVATAIRARRTK